jgi:hypothetical protein
MNLAAITCLRVQVQRAKVDTRRLQENCERTQLRL